MSVALVVDLPADEVRLAHAAEGRGALAVDDPAAQEPRRRDVAVSPRRRCGTTAVVSPLLVWDVAEGVVDGALDALREGAAPRRACTCRPPTSWPRGWPRSSRSAWRPSARARRRTATGQWGPTKLGPTADALWLACDGYLDLLDAQAAGGRTAQLFSSSSYLVPVIVKTMRRAMLTAWSANRS